MTRRAQPKPSAMPLTGMSSASYPETAPKSAGKQPSGPEQVPKENRSAGPQESRGPRQEPNPPKLSSERDVDEDDGYEERTDAALARSTKHPPGRAARPERLDPASSEPVPGAIRRTCDLDNDDANGGTDGEEDDHYRQFDDEVDDEDDRDDRDVASPARGGRMTNHDDGKRMAERDRRADKRSRRDEGDDQGSGAVRRTGRSMFPTVAERSVHAEDKERWAELIRNLPEAAIPSSHSSREDREKVHSYNTVINNLKLAIASVRVPLRDQNGMEVKREIGDVVRAAVTRSLIFQGMRAMTKAAALMEEKMGQPQPGGYMSAVASAQHTWASMRSVERDVTPLPELLSTDVDLPSPDILTDNYNPLYVQWAMANLLTDPLTRDPFARQGVVMATDLRRRLEESVSVWVREGRRTEKHQQMVPKRAPAPAAAPVRAAAAAQAPTLGLKTSSPRLCQTASCGNALSDDPGARQHKWCRQCTDRYKSATRASRGGSARGGRNNGNGRIR